MAVHQHGDTQGVREKNELLPGGAAHLTRAGQEVDGVAPLVEGELDIAHEVVQVANQTGHDRFQTRVGGALKALDHGLGDASLVELAHEHLLL